jgi:PEP-CTERM motif
MNAPLRALSALALAALLAAPAGAALIPVLVAVTPDTGGYRWTYSVNATSDVQVNTGDFFTVYDFAGLVPSSLQAPAGWAVATPLTGPTPSQVLPTDDPAVANLAFTYAGVGPLAGPLALGGFSAVSAYGSPADGEFTSHTHRTIDGRPENNVTPTEVPVPSPVGGNPPPQTPEPATLALAGAGLAALAGRRLARGRRAGR